MRDEAFGKSHDLHELKHRDSSNNADLNINVTISGEGEMTFGPPNGRPDGRPDFNLVDLARGVHDALVTAKNDIGGAIIAKAKSGELDCFLDCSGGGAAQGKGLEDAVAQTIGHARHLDFGPGGGVAHGAAGEVFGEVRGINTGGEGSARAEFRAGNGEARVLITE